MRNPNMMAPSHTIRLREPWQTDTTADHRVRLRRRFSWTAKLATGERVLLAIGAATSEGCVWLNDTRLGSFTTDRLPARFDITPLLRPRNEVVIELSDGTAGEVRLEIVAASSEPVAS